MSDVAVVGSYVQDLAFKTADFPLPGQTIIGDFLPGPGGKGFNQAVASHRQQAATVFIGAVGKDIFAEGVRSFAAREKLQVELEEIAQHPTGAAGILVNEQSQNMIVVALGANAVLSPEFIRSKRSTIEKCQILLVQAEANISAFQEALIIARSKEITTIFNPAPINGQITGELLQLADIITPNETELAFLLSHLADTKISDDVPHLSDSELSAAVARLHHPCVIVTLGAEGAFVCRRGEASFRIPAIEAHCVDTTGAGDAFNGGLAAALLQFKDDLATAVRYASVVAGLSTEKPGTAPSMPTRAEVHARFTA